MGWKDYPDKNSCWFGQGNERRGKNPRIRLLEAAHEVKGRIGVLHEKPRFPPWATGKELLKYVAQGEDSNEVEKRVDYCWRKLE